MPLFDAQSEQLERRAPFGRSEVRQVSFTAVATDTIIRHSLPTPDPNQIDYEVIRANAPAVVYHDGDPDRREWGEGFIVLRSSAVGTVDLRLSVSSEPIQIRKLPSGDTTSAEDVDADTLDGLTAGDFARSNEPFVTTGATSGLSAETVLAGGTGISVVGATVSLAATYVPGTYLPTLTNTTNLDASTAYTCQYLRFGTVVVVSGKVDLDPTAAGSVVLGISLPVASNFANAEQLGGTAFCPAIAGQGAALLADTANDRATLQFIAVDTTNQPMYFTFVYQVL
jgi:hypothetical protein